MIIKFITLYWLDLIVMIAIFIMSIIPIFPPEWGGANKTWRDYDGSEKPQKNFNLIELIVRLFSSVVLLGPALSIGFRGTVTLILFIVLISDLVLNKSITNNAITISIVAIVALYAEQMINSAEEITLGKVFTWKAKHFEIPKQTQGK